jgi:hypothetical protein
MDPDANAVQAGGSFERRRGPSILVGVVGILVLVALVKPWSFGGDGAGGGSSRATGRPAADASGLEDVAVAPATSPETPDANAIACFSSNTEQLVLLERWPGNEVRSWIAVASASATGPLDPAIPTTTIHSSHLVGIGVCPPRPPNGPQFGAAVMHDIQLVTMSSANRAAVDLGVWPPLTKVPEDPGSAMLYGPPPSPGPTGDGQSPGASIPGPVPSGAPLPATWPIGTYVLSFAVPNDLTTQIRWLRIEIRAGPRGAG